MDYIATISNIILGTAIVVFACLTWLTTRSYSRLTGLSLLMTHLGKLLTLPEDAERRASVEAMKVIREEFPDIYNRFRARINNIDRGNIEGTGAQQD